CLPGATASLEPTQVDFGTVELNQVKRWIFQYKNTGPRTLGIPVVEVMGGDFLVVDNTCQPLNAGNACRITVGFRPQTVGPQTGILSVTASPASPVTSKLQGLGVEPDAGADGSTDAAADG